MTDITRTIRTTHGYQGFSTRVNGVTVSTWVSHGEIPSGDTREREYTVCDGVLSLWHPSQTPFTEIGTRVSAREFAEICRRHGLTFSVRRI